MRSRMAHPTSLRLDEVQPNPRNPRYADDDPQVHELAATLHRVGQLQPALVITREQYATAYPDETMLGPQPWVVIVGNRRLAAARVASRAAIDVRVTADLSDRKDLPPLLEAEVLQRRLDQPGQTLRSVAAAIEKTHTYVAQRLALLKLIPELQRMLRDGQISIRNGRELGARAADQQRAILVQIATMSEKETRAFLAGVAGEPGNGAAAGNPVSSSGAGVAGAARKRGNGAAAGNLVSSSGLDAARLTVVQWLDNAAADLDRVLPAGGEAGTGQKLTEARRLIEEARSLLR